ncbi:MAG TPA: LysR family transcriptional regulator [Steroidobacteraceae bacterium]|jgi:DNA-binding transcriptional LysR family regulator|nr:LysR family transcriptional regulator [Steroidobacteraceae bacterium]
MWLASEMAAFAHVSELKSFTAAAHALGVPKVAVSRAILSLERRLGTRLLIRTTRRVALTAAGALLLPHSQRLLAEVEAVRARFAPAGADQRRLRVIVDPGYGRLLVTPLIPRFLERYAGFELQVVVVDTLPEGPGEDWDLLVCNDTTQQSGTQHPALTRTPLGSPPLLLCATPAYLARHGRPKTPAQLSDHSVLRALDAAADGESAAGTLRLRRDGTGRGAARREGGGRDGEQQPIRLRPALQVNDPALVHASTAAGLGIGVLPEFLCRQGLAMGKLERVLPEWSVAAPLQLQAVYAAERAGSPAIRQFVEFVLANMVPVLGGPAADS